MFARSVSFRLKPGRAAEFTRLLDKDIIPMLRKQKGFQDEITLVAPGGADAIGISVWDLKENAETLCAAARMPVCSRCWSTWSRARLRCRRTRCPTRRSTRSPFARLPERWHERRVGIRVPLRWAGKSRPTGVINRGESS